MRRSPPIDFGVEAICNLGGLEGHGDATVFNVVTRSTVVSEIGTCGSRLGKPSRGGYRSDNPEMDVPPGDVARVVPCARAAPTLPATSATRGLPAVSALEEAFIGEV